MIVGKLMIIVDIILKPADRYCNNKLNTRPLTPHAHYTVLYPEMAIVLWP